jgi:hypothetical protein
MILFINLLNLGVCWDFWIHSPYKFLKYAVGKDEVKQLASNGKNHINYHPFDNNFLNKIL